jgi:hypothetical protein
MTGNPYPYARLRQFLEILVKDGNLSYRLSRARNVALPFKETDFDTDDDKKLFNKFQSMYSEKWKNNIDTEEFNEKLAILLLDIFELSVKYSDRQRYKE